MIQSDPYRISVSVSESESESESESDTDTDPALIMISGEKNPVQPTKHSKMKCPYCPRSYELKKNYKQHILSCELFHQIHTKRQDEFTEENEKIPDMKTMFQYVKEIAAKCQKLEKEVVFLRNALGKKQVKNMMECLNTSYLPNQHFTEWYSQIQVHLEDLICVFKEDLIVGMKNVLKRYIFTEKKIPIAAFTHKANALYVYAHNPTTETSEWRLMHSDDLSMFIYTFNRMFIIEFSKWQKENRDLIETSEKMKDTEIHYMIKVNGMRLTNEKKMAEIKKWMFSELAKDLELIEYIL